MNHFPLSFGAMALIIVALVLAYTWGMRHIYQLFAPPKTWEGTQETAPSLDFVVMDAAFSISFYAFYGVMHTDILTVVLALVVMGRALWLLLKARKAWKLYDEENAHSYAAEQLFGGTVY